MSTLDVEPLTRRLHSLMVGDLQPYAVRQPTRDGEP